jgi:hypothetical protein
MALPPARLTGNDLGGPKEDEGTPTNNRKYHLGREINLSNRSVIGMNLTTARAQVLMEWSGGEMTNLFSGETWDPDEAIVPTLARSEAGKYTVQYAASYEDYDGEPVAPALIAAEAVIQTLDTALRATALVQGDGRTVDVWVWNKDTDVFTDARVLVKVY